MTTLASRDAVTRFCVRHLPPAQHAELHLTEPVWAHSTSTALPLKGCRWLLLARDELCLADNPPKRLLMTLPLVRVARIESGRALPAFLPRGVAERTQQVVVWCRPPERPSRRSDASEGSLGVGSALGGFESHSNNASFTRNTASPTPTSTSPQPRPGPRGSIDISAALEAAAGPPRAQSPLPHTHSPVRQAHFSFGSAHGSTMDLSLVEDTHRLSLSPLASAPKASSAPVSPRWARKGATTPTDRIEERSSPAARRVHARDPRSPPESDNSARRSSRGLRSYFQRGGSNPGGRSPRASNSGEPDDGNCSNSNSNPLSPASVSSGQGGPVTSPLALGSPGGTGPVSPSPLATPTSPPTPIATPPVSAEPLVPLSFFTMQEHTLLLPCLEEAWASALVRATLRHTFDDANDTDDLNDNLAPSVAETRFRRAWRRATETQPGTTETRLDALEECCAMLRASLSCCRAFWRTDGSVAAALREAATLMAPPPPAADVTECADRLETALLWLDVVIHAARGATGVAERRQLVAGDGGRQTLALAATLCGPPPLPAAALATREVADLTRDIANGTLEFLAVLCHVSELVGLDTSMATEMDAAGGGSSSSSVGGDVGSSSSSRGGRGGSRVGGDVHAPASGMSGDAPLSRRDLLSALCREPAFETHVVDRLVRNITRVLGETKSAVTIRPRRLVRLHRHLELLVHLLELDSPVRALVLRRHATELQRTIGMRSAVVAAAAALPLTPIIRQQLDQLAKAVAR